MLRFRKILLCNKVYYLLFILTIIITITRLVIPKNSSYSSSSNKFIGIITNIKKQEEYQTIYLKNKETVILTIPNNYNLHLGDKIKVLGEFQRIKKNTTPNIYNYQKYCYQRNIFYQIKVEKLIIITKNKSIYYLLREKIYNHLKYNPYLLTFLLGDKTYLNEEAKSSYQENGISHLFAISGMHITLFSSIIDKLLKKRKISENNRFIVISIILLIYLFLVGLAPSMLRGVLFYYLFTLNRIYYFYIKRENLWLVCISISLLINPFYIMDIGFLYSYLISFSLLKMQDTLKSNNYFKSLLKVSLLSFFVSIPISLYNFYQLNILSIIYNLLFVPLISIVIFPLSLIVGILPFLLPIYELLTQILERISIILSTIKIGTLLFPKTINILYIIYLLLIIIYLHLKKKILIVSVLILLIIHLFIPILDSNKYIDFIDVGQGDSTIIRMNHKTIIIDTGGNPKKEGLITTSIIKPYLKSKGINKIQTLIITHGDYDHMGEAINLVNNFKVEKVIFNCGPYNDLEKELIKVLDKKHINYYSCIKELNIDNNKLYFLQTKEYDDENDNSNVIYTELNGYKFMFMGDAGIVKEKDILEKYNISDIDVLKVGHHGSRTSSSKEFIDEINTKYSIISVGKNNRYGHPNKEVLKNLVNSKIYRTDEDGSIMFKIKNNKLKIGTGLP